MDGPRAGGGGADQLRRFRRLADLTVLATFALIVLGGIVRVSESGLGCGPGGSGTEGWPLCNGSVIHFFSNTQEIIESSHRVLAAIVTGLIVALAWVSYRHLRELRWPLRLTVAAAVLVLVQAGLGALVVENSLAEELVAAHLGLAMILIGTVLWVAVRTRVELSARGSEADEGQADARPIVSKDGPVRGLKPYAGVAAVLLLCTIIAGGYVAGTEEEGIHGQDKNIPGAHMACGDVFPTCLNDNQFLPFGESRLVDIQLTHRVFVYLTTAAILLLLGVAYRRGVRSRLLWIVLALLFGQVLLGASNVWLGEHATLIVAHLITATLLWTSLLLIGYRFALAPQPAGASAGARPTAAGAAATA